LLFAALEALIVTLRTHLARLTSELSSHQQLLSELRVLRERDARTLRDKSAEVERLREEVEKLAGEVEVLKGVVEEGLNERRAMKQVREKSDEEESPHAPQAGRMMRTDHATLGSSANAKPSRRFIDGEELDRISLELEERRSDRSREASDDGDRLRRDNRAPSPSTVARGPPMPATHAQSTSRPAAPITANSSRRPSHGRSKPAMAADDDSSAIPFPQIRGGHLERLFFSAPEHNAKTCTVCHRRRRRPDSPSWIPRRANRDTRARVEDADTDD
jgi:Centrosome localisation domain of PPC89